MVKNSRGTLSGNTRRLKGRMDITVCQQVKTFEIGTKVIISQRAITKGQPHMRYNARHGKIIKKQGKCYVVEVQDGGKKKQLIASPIHLKEAEVSTSEQKNKPQVPKAAA
jgi:large subunit ribosomal protein L21e